MDLDTKMPIGDYQAHKQRIIEQYGPENPGVLEIVSKVEETYNNLYYIVKKENMKACPLMMKFMKETIALEKIKPERE